MTRSKLTGLLLWALFVCLFSDISFAQTQRLEKELTGIGKFRLYMTLEELKKVAPTLKRAAQDEMMWTSNETITLADKVFTPSFIIMDAVMMVIRLDYQERIQGNPHETQDGCIRRHSDILNEMKRSNVIVTAKSKKESRGNYFDITSEYLSSSRRRLLVYGFTTDQEPEICRLLVWYYANSGD